MSSSVEELVLQYQDCRENAVFNELYTELLPLKKVLLLQLRKSMPTTIPYADIESIYDDAIFYCAHKFSPGKGCAFKTFVSMEVEDSRKMHLRKLGATKRRADLTAVPLDAKLDNDTETAVVDMLTDDTATDAEDVLVAEGILDSLRAFRESSEKNEMFASLVALDAVYFETREEKHAAMCQLLGKDISTSGLHKKVKKAKIAFREFLGENN